MVKVREDMTGWVMTEHGVPNSRLKVIKQVEDYVSPTGQHQARWLCECSCKEHNKVTVTSNKLKRGDVMSCGCMSKEKSSQRWKDRHLTNAYDLSGDYGIGWTSNTNKEFYFDLEDYDKIKDIYWHEHFNKSYSILVGRDITTGKNVKMHILLGYRGYDHIDRNALNNKKDNFRQATKQENARNHSLAKNNTSGFIGVSWDKQCLKWSAYIIINKKHKRIGRFEDKNDAIVARLEAELKYFGAEFAPQRHLFEEYGITTNPPLDNTKLM